MPPAANQQMRARCEATYGFRDKIDTEGVNHPKRMIDLTIGLFRRKCLGANTAGILGGN